MFFKMFAHQVFYPFTFRLVNYNLATKWAHRFNIYTIVIGLAVISDLKFFNDSIF